ncbi:MAG: phosphatidylglycerophosphatase A [Rhodovarius sp.]|nr:phosphatidylglycerophosphatase A [Rhodovarius sp.]
MRWLASLGGVGFLRPAPGSWASLAVLPLALLGPAAAAAAAVLLAALGLWVLSRLAPQERDPPWVVIDEGAGMALALAGLSAASPEGLAAAFLLFRFFDIAKPGPVGWAERLPGPAGIMADDLMAGLFAGLCLQGLSGLGLI